MLTFLKTSVLAVLATLLSVQPPLPPSNLHVVTSGVLSVANLSVAGCFLTNGVQTGNWTTDYPVAFRRVGAARQYFQMGGDGLIYESTEPTLLPCSTAINALNVGASVRVWTGLVLHGSQQYPDTSGTGQGSIRGLFYDTTTGKLIVGWAGTYTNLPSGINTFAVLTLNSGAGTVSVDGCYAPPYTMPYTAGGVVDIPAAFISANGLGTKRLGFLGGLFASATSGNNYGPGIIALPLPASNACGAGVDNPISAGTILAEYAGNALGPTCRADQTTESGFFLGCTPTPSVLTPRPARTSYVTYSYDLYTADWDPYGGYGYFADYTGWRTAWYDDGVKAALVVPFTASAGYLKTTITGTTGPGNVTLASTDTHDGNRLNPGDAFILKTCTVGVDAGCASANGNSFSVVIADTVNTGTGVVTYHISPSGQDACLSCNHTPVVGQPAYGGPVYPHATPGWMRSTLRLQLYAVSQLASVVSGAAPYTPQYTEETALYGMGVTTLGDPSVGSGIHAGFVGDQMTVTGVIPDPTAHQIVIFIRDAQLFGGTIPRSLGIVLNVAP